MTKTTHRDRALWEFKLLRASLSLFLALLSISLLCTYSFFALLNISLLYAYFSFALPLLALVVDQVLILICAMYCIDIDTPSAGDTLCNIGYTPSL